MIFPMGLSLSATISQCNRGLIKQLCEITLSFKLGVFQRSNIDSMTLSRLVGESFDCAA